MYPLLILTAADRTTPSGIDRLVAAQAAASAVGAATLPLLFGLAMNTSPSAFAPIMAAAAAVAALLQLALRMWRSTTNASRVPETKPTQPQREVLGRDRDRPACQPQPLVGQAGVIWTFMDNTPKRRLD